MLPSTVYFKLEKNRKTSLAILQDDETDVDPYIIQVPGNLDPPSLSKLRYNLVEFEERWILVSFKMVNDGYNNHRDEHEGGG